MIHTIKLRYRAGSLWLTMERPAPEELRRGTLRPCDMALTYKGKVFTYMGHGQPEGYTMFSEVDHLELVD